MVGGVVIGTALTGSAIITASAVTGGSPDIVQLITGLGFPTAFIVAWLMGWICSGKELDRAIGDRDAERIDRMRLQNALSDRVAPGVNRQALAWEQVLPLIQEGARLREAAPMLDDIARVYRESQQHPHPSVRSRPDEVP